MFRKITYLGVVQEVIEWCNYRGASEVTIECSKRPCRRRSRKVGRVNSDGY